MFEVKKSGKTEYGFWAYGVLKYQGLQIVDIFTIDTELQPDSNYEVKNVLIKRTKKGNLKFKLEI